MGMAGVTVGHATTSVSNDLSTAAVELTGTIADCREHQVNYVSIQMRPTEDSLKTDSRPTDTSFFLIVDTCLYCEDIARQTCAVVPRW